ncbi:MAG: hypothetical protein IPP34_20565 [Bacteroidetes bacterium]|nr:hypothetical protein [Bacteroidota bacterium]
MSIVDLDLNGGLGSVILKNYPIISDTLNCGKITATRHANGRDWWVVCHRVNTNILQIVGYTIWPSYSD